MLLGPKSLSVLLQQLIPMSVELSMPNPLVPADALQILKLASEAALGSSPDANLRSFREQSLVRANQEKPPWSLSRSIACLLVYTAAKVEISLKSAYYLTNICQLMSAPPKTIT